MRFVILATMTLVVAAPCSAERQDHTPQATTVAPKEASARAEAGSPPTAEDADAFVAKAEAELAALQEHSNRVSWIAITYITVDSNWLKAKLDGELAMLQAAQAKEAATFDHVDVDPLTRRKLDILKRNIVLAPPDRPGAAEDLANTSVELSTHYSTAKVEYRGKELTLEDIAEIMRTSRDPAELKQIWEGWHANAIPLRADYSRLVALANEGARELGYADTGVLWRSWYDMAPAQFAETMDRLWSEFEPFYKNLHCYVRTRLNEKYGDTVQPRTGPIRADLLGNMWAQDWGNIYDLLEPKGSSLGYDLTAAVDAHGYDAVKLVRTAENFYTSIGFSPLPETFWDRSMFARPRDREVDCHPQAWDIDDKEDVRMGGCLRANSDDFYTAHHELGHSFYALAYKDQPHLFKGGANDGFHEATGDFVGLYSVSPSYLKEIGLIEDVPGEEADMPFLLRMALEKIAFLPFAYIMDRWRWQVFAGEIAPERYNDGWWALRTKYQGIVPPGLRPAEAFDPGAKYHIVASVPYARYFLSTVYQFQFFQAACRRAGWTGPLNRCSIYGNKDVGERFQAMLRMGQSKPWPDALEAFTGERDIDAGAIVAYFAPLDHWLTEQTKGETCGW